ncbi:MAG: D-aminoacyl-tRNA deacylase [Erysipelotrichaceae bacterium]|nr:D-aminoacyl-tRNA deacylase [Erysipelotrichaceae bacterium]
MRIVAQRCRKASVLVEDKIVGKIDQGLVLLVGFTQGDSSIEIDYLVDKVLHLRVFDDEFGVMNRSLLDVGGSILSVSQFTLYADTKKGRRPSYVKALNGEQAIKLYHQFNQKLESYSVLVEKGIFGADMQIDFVNDGPVTILLEKEREEDGE